jgi:flagellar basal-body rod modification protein FlgD
MNTAIAPVNGNDYYGTGAPVKKAQSDLDMETFLRLLTAQLANQNPLEPMNDRDFFAQMAQLGTVQGIDKLKSSAEVDQANLMIGKQVTAIRTGSETNGGKDAFVTGIVQGVTLKNGERLLQVREANGGISEVKMGNIQSMQEAPATAKLDTAVGLANSAQFIGKTLNGPHPTLKDASGKPENLTGKVSKVSFENNSVFFTVQDRTGANVKVNLLNVLSFGE